MYNKEENEEALLGINASAERLSKAATGLVLAGTILVICATAIALSYHLYCMKGNAPHLSSRLGKLYLILSSAVLVVTGVLIGGIITYACRRSVPLESQPAEEEAHVNAKDHSDSCAQLQHNDSHEMSDEHDENCFSCMPDILGDPIPGRSLNVLERSDEHIQRRPMQEGKEDLRTSTTSTAVSVPRFNSDGSVKPGSARHVVSGLYDYAIFALNGTDISEAQLNDVKRKKLKEVIPTSLQNGGIRAVRNKEDSPFRVVTYSPRDGYPSLTQDLHIIRKVKFPFGWRVNNDADVMIEVPRNSAMEPADFVYSNVFYSVDMAVTYCNLLKLMFSYQAISSGDTEKLFIRYLRFYYSELWEFAVEVEDDARKSHLTGFDVLEGLYYSPIGARFAADIAQNYASMKVFMEGYRCDGEALVLFAFLESVRLCTPNNFAHPADVRSGHLYEVMCAIYGLSCRKGNALFKDGNLAPATSMVLHYMFYFQEQLRKALIINAIMEETFTPDAEERSFLCSQIYYLENSVKTILRVCDATTKDKDTFAKVVRDLYAACEANKHMLAAVALSTDGETLGLRSMLEGFDGYKVRLDEFKRLQALAKDPGSCFNLSLDLDASKQQDVFNCIPYAVFSTIKCLEKEEKASVIFDPGDGDREVRDEEGLLDLYRDVVRCVDSYFLECMWHGRASLIGRGFYQGIMKDKARGMYVLPIKEEFIAIRTIPSRSLEGEDGADLGAAKISENSATKKGGLCKKDTPVVMSGGGEDVTSTSGGAPSEQQLASTSETSRDQAKLESTPACKAEVVLASPSKPSRSVKKISVSSISSTATLGQQSEGMTQ